MKKKVALLLALVMVLSLVPMNVFGQVNAITISNNHTQSTSQQYAVVEFSAAQLALMSATSGVSIQLTVAGTNTGIANARINNIFGTTTTTGPTGIRWQTTAASTTPLAMFLAANPLAEINRAVPGTNPAYADGTRTVLVGATAPFPSGATGTVQIIVPMLMNHENITLAARLETHGNVATSATTRLIPEERVANINFPSVTAREQAEDVLVLPPIPVNEGQRNNFAAASTRVRLEAPFGYRFVETNNITVRPIGLQWGDVSGYPLEAGQTTHRNILNTVSTQREENVNNTNVNVIYVYVSTPTAPVVGLTGARQFELRNIRMVPEDLRHASLGRVDLHISVINTPVANHWNYDPGVTGQRRPENYENRQRAAFVHVANRVASGFRVTRLGTLPEVRTGYLGANSELTPFNFINSPAPNNVQPYGVKTATIQITELAPGAWGSAAGGILEFRFEQQGVALVGAAMRMGRNVGGTAFYNMPGLPGAGGATGTALYNRRLGGFIQTDGPTGNISSRVNQTIFHDNIRINEDRVEVRVPALTGLQAVEYRRSVQVTFWLSIEAGFEARNPGEDIYVTIGGAGAHNIAEADRVIAVATPFDPVSVRMVDGTTQLRTDLVGDTVANERISDIEITIYEPHLLLPGSRLNVFIAGIEANRNLGLHMYADRAVTVDGNGLLFGGPTFSVNQGGVTAGNIMSFPITRIPSERENNGGPVTVTITNVRVTGTVVPGVEYFAVAAGTAVSANWDAATPGIGVFTDHPYFASAISNVRAPQENVPQPPTTNQPPVRTTHHLWAGMPALGGVTTPFMWEIVGPNRVAMVSLRSFGHLLNGETVVGGNVAGVSWNPGLAQAQLTAQDNNGEYVTIAVWTGEPQAAISRAGQPQQNVDIATAVGGQSGPAGSVRPVFVNDRIYLPLRFFADAFGFDVTVENDVVTLTPR